MTEATHLSLHSCTHTKQTFPSTYTHTHTPTTKNQVYCSLCFHLFFLLFYILKIISFIFHMLPMKQPELCFLPLSCYMVELCKQYKLLNSTNMCFLQSENMNNTTQCIMCSFSLCCRFSQIKNSWVAKVVIF